MAYKIIKTKQEFKDAYDKIINQKYTAFDIETNTLDRFSKEAKLITIAFSTPECIYGFKAYNKNDDVGIEYTPEDTINLTKDILENIDITKVGHNVKFDLNFMYVVYNFNKSIFKNSHDTIILTHLNDENIPLNLDYQAEYYLKIPKHKSMVDNTKLEITKLSTVLQYNMLDVYKTDLLFQHLYPIIENDSKLYKVYTKEKIKLVYSLSMLENNGMNIDIENIEKYKKEYSKRLHLLQENYKLDIIKATGDKRLLNLKLTETEQLKEAFIKLGFELTHLTKGGKEKQTFAKETGKKFIPTIKELTLDFDSLDDLTKIPKHIKDKAEHQNKIDKYIKPLLQFREEYKIYSTYLKGLYESISDDGKIHCSYNITGTKTGRLSSSNPNLQNIPRDSIVKNLFIADKGKVFIELDVKTGELKIMAIKSGDKAMIEAFNQGIDLHKKTAALVFKIDIKDVQKWQRQIAKTLNFGLIYGMSANALFETLMQIPDLYKKVMDENDEFDLSVDICQEFMNEYFKVFSGVKAYLDKNLKDTLANGYCETLAGQRRHFEQMITFYENGIKGYYGKISRQAGNAPIQGSLGNMANFNINRIQNWIDKNNLDIQLVGTVHDSILAQMPKKLVKEYIDTTTYIFENIPKDFIDTKGITMSIDFKLGTEWGSMYPVELKDDKLVFIEE